MENNKAIELLNDLIHIHKDRIMGYEKAIKELKDPTLQGVRVIFMERADESRNFNSELSETVIRLGGEPATETTPFGNLYRVWMDLKTTLTGGSIKSVFELCEFGEDVAVKTYDKAIGDNIDWPDGIYAMLTHHRHALKDAHDMIKNYRDRVKAGI